MPTAAPTVTPTAILNETVTPDPKGSKPWAFEEIDNVAAKAGKRNLRAIQLDANDIEIRVWGGFGRTGTQGFILNRTGKQWAAVVIRPEFKKPRTWKFNVVSLAEPSQSWDKAWQALLNQRRPHVA